jgi:hypothetical protein
MIGALSVYRRCLCGSGSCRIPVPVSALPSLDTLLHLRFRLSYVVEDVLALALRPMLPCVELTYGARKWRNNPEWPWEKNQSFIYAGPYRAAPSQAHSVLQIPKKIEFFLGQK